MRREITSTSGRIFEATLTEPTAGAAESGMFRTAFAEAEAGKAVAVSVGLGVGSESLSPIWVDARCPRMMADVHLPALPLTVRNNAGELQAFGLRGHFRVRNCCVCAGEVRTLPVVAVSDEHGDVLHPGIDEGPARDLAGLATVARLEPQASWRVSDAKGKPTPLHLNLWMYE